MYAAANAQPMPATGPSLGGKWIKANLLIAITVPLTTGLLPFVLDRMIPETVSNHTMGWVNAVLTFFVIAVNMAVYAILTGSVLSEKLPAFSRRVWIAAHLAFAAVFGLMAKATFSPAPATGGARLARQDRKRLRPAWYGEGCRDHRPSIIGLLLVVGSRYASCMYHRLYPCGNDGAWDTSVPALRSGSRSRLRSPW